MALGIAAAWPRLAAHSPVDWPRRRDPGLQKHTDCAVKPSASVAAAEGVTSLIE